MGLAILSRSERFQPAGKTTATVADGKPVKPPAGGSQTPHAGKPGADAPEHLRDSQPEGKPKMSMMDKLSAAGNIVGAGASIFPLFQSHKDQGQKADSTPPGVEDKTEYYQGKLMTAVGPPPVNW